MRICLILHYGFVDSVNLSKFLWKDAQRVASEMFPENQLGQYVLTRDTVVQKIKKAMASQLSLRPGASQSVYISGCRGSGKTSLQMLLARYLKEVEGYEVYFFKSAQDIPQGASLAFEAMLEDKTKKVAVLIDEVDSNPESGLFTALLKGAYPHLVTIGSSVPRFIPTGLTASFKSVLRMTDLVLREDDEDFQKLVQHCVRLKATTPELTQIICKFLLKQCGGHTFPTLAFIEYFFTHDDARDFLVSEEAFYHYFCGPDFARSPFYESVRNRCFEQLLDAETEKVAFRVLGGKEEAGDISTVTRLGWWNPEASDFISRFLVNACLSGVQPGTDGVLYLDKKKSYEENTELVIVEGLAGMDESDFKCWQHKTGVRVENGVSFNWAQKARAKIPNAYLHFQERGNIGVVDFYLNGFADTAIEVMLDATQTVNPKTKGGTQDIDAHLKRFEDGDYPWKRNALLNFAMKAKKKKDRIILPRNTSAHDKVYTFVRSTNTLYRGTTPIKTPAIPKLSGGSRFVSPDQTTRSFSTVAKRFMTCMRRW